MDTKICKTCNKNLPLDMFGKYKRSQDGLQPSCRDCKRAYDRARYNANHQHNKQRKKIHTAARKDILQKYLIDYLLEHPCEQCGESDIRCLEFDHINPDTKSGNVSDIVNQTRSMTKLKKEIFKCRVLCANCHMKHSSAQRNDYKHRYLKEV